MTDATSAAEWNVRAAAAEHAVMDRYVLRMPGIAWARSAWPAIPAALRRRDGRAGWHYWWSAHLVDAAVGAARHRPSAGRDARARAYARGIRLRNGGTFGRPFWDDLAWLGLAFERAGRLVGREAEAERIAASLEAAIDPTVGAIPWEVGSHLYNAPANGPAAILFARTGRAASSQRLAEWIHGTLHDPASGLIHDGIVVDGGKVETVAQFYTYCQGVTLAAYVSQPGAVFAERAAALVEAIDTWCGGVLPGSGGGDGGLFAGITCRYLADAAGRLEQTHPAAAASARRIVTSSAGAAWRGAATIAGRPLFAADWRAGASDAPDAPERDLSVQLGAWLALEAAVDVTA